MVRGVPVDTGAENTGGVARRGPSITSPALGGISLAARLRTGWPHSAV